MRNAPAFPRGSWIFSRKKQTTLRLKNDSFSAGIVPRTMPCLTDYFALINFPCRSQRNGKKRKKRSKTLRTYLLVCKRTLETWTRVAKTVFVLFPPLNPFSTLIFYLMSRCDLEHVSRHSISRRYYLHAKNILCRARGWVNASIGTTIRPGNSNRSW